MKKILGIFLIFLLLSGFGNPSVIESVKQNMKIVQEIIEDYANKTDGIFPGEISYSFKTEKDEKRKKLISILINPAFKDKNAFIDYYIYAIESPQLKYNFGSGAVFAGMVVYQPLAPYINEYAPYRSEYSRYRLYGTDANGELIRENGKPFFIERINTHPKLGISSSRNVIDNMYDFLQLLRLYRDASGDGFYPTDIDSLYQQAVLKEFWKNLKNPFTKKIQKEDSIINYHSYQKIDNKNTLKGKVVYQPENCIKNEDDKTLCKQFKIYGLDENGEIIKINNITFFLDKYSKPENNDYIIINL
jgi:hypothetical protein